MSVFVLWPEFKTSSRVYSSVLAWTLKVRGLCVK